MSKFYVGQKVMVLKDNPESAGVKIGDVVKVTKFLGVDSIGENYNLEGGWYVHGKYLSPITEAPETLTVNGVEYIRKPEPEHEWKFGDIAMHDDYGVGMVFSEPDYENDVRFAHNDDWDWADIEDLTFLRRADLSV